MQCFNSGGTADISVHEKQGNEKLREVHRACGGPWGGIYVDAAYMKFLASIFGTKALEELKSTEMIDYFDILREFEAKKRAFVKKDGATITLRVSTSLREISEKHIKETLSEKVAKVGYGKKVTVRGKDKLRIDSSVMEQWFDEPIGQLVDHVAAILQDETVSNINTVLLVGGFGESQYVQQRIKDGIGHRKLVVPGEAGLAVLKGAVRFGHDSTIVESRVLSYTYGMRVKALFDESKHPTSKLVIENGQKVVYNSFKVFVKANEQVNIGTETTMEVFRGQNTKRQIFVYRTPNPDPVFTTDDGCEKLGNLIIDFQQDTREVSKFDITFVFGGTELRVKTEMGGKKYDLIINCLE